MEELIKVNHLNTKFTEEHRKKLPREVFNDVLNDLTSIVFINNLISPSRGYIVDKPIMTYQNEKGEEVEYEDGRREVDLINPHILEDMDYFRERAIFYEKHGKYTNITPNPNPNSDYALFWKEELRRWKYGLVRPDGEWIPGELYYYWNYSRIWLTGKDKNNKSRRRGERKNAFPRPWLGDYLFHHYIHQAKENGQHGKMLKTRGIGFAQPNATILQKPEGTIRMGDVKVGDKLLDRYGNETEVLEIFPKGKLDTYKVTLMDGRTTECSGDHLWSVYDKNKGSKNKEKLYTYKTTDLLEKGLYWNNKNGNNLYKFYIPDLVEHVKYSKKDLFIPPYVMGALLGDGALTGTNTRIATDDKEILDRILQLMPDFYLTKDNTSNNYDLIDSKRYSKGKNKNRLKTEIRRLKLDVTSKNKFIPSIYKYSSYEQRLELVKGLMDTDGSINKSGNIEFSNSNKRLIDDLASVLRSMGISCTKGKGRAPHEKVINGRSCKVSQEYRLYIRTNLDIFNLPRKSERVRTKNIFRNNAIVSIEKLKIKKESTCLLVDNKEHLYLTDDFIPTHNSFKCSSWSPRNMYVFPGSGNPNFHLASDKSFLSGDSGIWGKVVDNLDWIANNTPLPRMRLVNSLKGMEIQIGYQDEHGVRKGLLSSVHGISLKDNPDKARGVRGPLIHYEEDGLFPQLEKAWGVNRKAVEDGGTAFGFMLAGGCLTENNFVWNNNGELVKISDLKKEDGIIGYDKNTQSYSKEDITYWQPPTNKECVKITTNTGRYIECSLDHPILWSHKSLKRMKELPSKDGKRKRQSLKKVEFKEAGHINVGDQIATINEIPIFSDKEMWEPRLIGWLVGDGSYGINKTPILSNCEGEINNYLHNQLIEEVITEKTYITKCGKNYEENRIKGICQKLRDIGIYGQTRDSKTLPKNIHSYSYKTITEFIGGFFDTDGYISKTGVISLSSGYSTILLEMQLLLQKLGIHGTIHYKKPNLNNIKSKNGHYELEIKDKDSILNFQKHITFYPKNKQERLNNIHLIYKNRKSQNASHLSGIRFERVVNIENIGIQPVYNLTAGKTNTYIGNGIITHNTGGVEGKSFEGSERLFYNPGAYNIYPLKNVFDKNADGTTECGYFWGAYMNRNNCYEEKNGEPDIVKSLIEIHMGRYEVKNSSTDANAITQYKAEEPITPQEAIMRTEGTVFPVSDLKEHLENISIRKDSFLAEHLVGDLVYGPTGKVEWRPNSDIYPLRSYDITSGSRHGAVEIFEMPKVNAEGEIANGRYIAGIDPIDSDRGNSLFSVLVMDTLTDRIVAEYTGRPRKASEAYEITLKLLLFYNAQANYESNLKGLFGYFEQRNYLYLLCDTPQILRDMELVKATNLYGNAAKGTRANAAINSWGRQLQADWQLSRVNPDKEDSNLKLHTIRSLAYLEECIKWNSDGNFDRVSAGGMLFILREERYKRIQYNKKNKDKDVNDLTNDKFFEKNYGSNSYL